MASHQHILLYSEPSSLLQQSETAVDKLLLVAKYQLPVVHSPGPLMGGTAPITMASGFWVGLFLVKGGQGVSPARTHASWPKTLTQELWAWQRSPRQASVHLHHAPARFEKKEAPHKWGAVATARVSPSV